MDETGLFWKVMPDHTLSSEAVIGGKRKAWMTGAIFSEWLRWFNKRINGRKVLLLIDGFSAYQAGIDLTNDVDYAMTNVRIEFLPKNATSVCQPLDQGIIRTWKAYYRQRWL